MDKASASSVNDRDVPDSGVEHSLDAGIIIVIDRGKVDAVFWRGRSLPDVRVIDLDEMTAMEAAVFDLGDETLGYGRLEVNNGRA